MIAVNYSTLRNNMKDCLNQVTEDCETLLITRTSDQDNVILLSEDSYETMQENLYLLQFFANQQWLAQSIEQLAAGLSRVQAMPGSDNRPVIFSENAWKDYCAWQAEDRKTAGRIDAMLADIAAAGSGNTARSRPLQGDLRGCRSRRISERDQLIYRAGSDSIQILACRYH